jgi:hypothetical protein
LSNPEKLIPLHGGYRKVKIFQVAQVAVSESRTLAALRDALLSAEIRAMDGLTRANTDEMDEMDSDGRGE